MYSYIGRECTTHNDNLVVVRAGLERVALLHFDGNEWYEMQPSITGDSCLSLGCSVDNIRWVFQGI